MRDDVARTEAYRQAIQQVAKGKTQNCCSSKFKQSNGPLSPPFVDPIRRANRCSAVKLLFVHFRCTMHPCIRQNSSRHWHRSARPPGDLRGGSWCTQSVCYRSKSRGLRKGALAPLYTHPHTLKFKQSLHPKLRTIRARSPLRPTRAISSTHTFATD